MTRWQHAGLLDALVWDEGFGKTHAVATRDCEESWPTDQACDMTSKAEHDCERCEQLAEVTLGEEKRDSTDDNGDGESKNVSTCICTTLVRRAMGQVDTQADGRTCWTSGG